MNLINWAKQEVKGAAQTVNRDVVKPVAQAVKAVPPPSNTSAPNFQGAKYGVLANNPQAQQQFTQSVAPTQFNLPKVALHSATHNPVTDLGGSIVKAPINTAIDTGNLLYNHQIAPNFNLPQVKSSQTPLKGIVKFSGANDSLHQAVGGGLQTALTLGSGGLGGVAEKGATGLTGLLAPKASAEAVTLARLGLNQVKKPLINTAIKYGTGALAGSGINAGFGTSQAIASGAKPKQILKSGLQSAAVGAPLGIAGPLAEDAIKGGKIVAQNVKPLNEVGAVGKNVDPKILADMAKRNSIPDPALQRTDALNKTTLAASEAPKLKQPNSLPAGGVNETLDYQGLKNKLVDAKAAVPAPVKPTNANPGGNMISNGDQAFARVFGNTPKEASKIINDKALAKTNLPVKPINTQVTTADRVISNTTGVPADQVAAERAAAQTKSTSKALSLMPNPSRKMADVPKVTGDLLPATSPNPIKQALVSKLSAIRNLGTPSAQTLADTIQNADRTKADLQAKYMYGMPTAQKLGKSDFTQAVDVVEGKVKSKDVSPKVAQGAKEIATTLKKVNKDAFAQGTLIGSRENYFPHSYDFKAIKNNPGQYDAALQHLIDTGQASTPEQAVQLFDKQAKQNDLWPTTFGNLERSRTTDMPGYAKTKDALNNYVGGASGRIAQATHLGTDNEVVRRLIGRIRLEGGNADTAAKAVEQYLRSPDTGQGVLSKVSADVRGVFSAARLGKAPISHLGQTSNTTVEAGVKNTLKGWGQFISNNAEHKDFVSKTGVTNPQNLKGYSQQYTGVRGRLNQVTAYGLNPVMKMNRSVTALAGREYGNALAKAGDTEKLTKLGVTGNIGSKLTPTQEVQAARGLVNDTMFNHSRAQTPLNAETAIGKTVGQYRLAYSYKQGGFIYKQILQEAGKGNLAPLARFLAVSAPVGAATVAVKNKISGNKEGPGGIAMDAAGALGGIPGETALELARYGKRDLTKSVAGIVAPAAGEAVTLAEDVQKALNGKPKQLGQYGLGLLPVVGSRVSKAVLPPANTTTKKTGVQQNNTSPLGTLSTYGKAAITSPGTTLHDLISGQRIMRVNNGALIVDRLPKADSQAVKTAGGGNNPSMKLDHTIPLQLGGTNAKSNLKLVPTATWAAYTPVEDTLGKALAANKINAQQATQMITDFKSGKITAQNVYDKLGVTAPTSTAAPVSTPQTKATAKTELASLKANPSKGYDLQQLSDGQYAYTINGKVTATTNLKTAQQAIAKDAFGNSPNSTQIIGDTVLRKAPDGTISSISKTKYDYDLGTATLTSQKASGDLSGYLKTAQSQLQSIATQLKDPSTDPLDAQTLQNQAQTLQNNINTYTSYGGFTKPKTTKSTSSKTTTKASLTSYLSALKSTNAAIKPPKAPTTPHFTVKSSGSTKTYKAPTLKKFAVSKVKASKVA